MKKTQVTTIEPLFYFKIHYFRLSNLKIRFLFIIVKRNFSLFDATPTSYIVIAG